MIKGIAQAGRYVTVTGGGSSTYVNGYSGLQGVGNLRYNTTNQNMEVYDGNNWISLSMDYVSVGLNSEAESLLDWAREQRERELKRQHLIKTNPALQKAYEAIRRAEDNFDLLEKFVEHDNDHGQVQQSP